MISFLVKNNNHNHSDRNDIVMEDTTTTTITTTTTTCQCSSSHRIHMTGIQKNHPWFISVIIVSLWILALMVMMIQLPSVSGSTISSNGNRQIPYPSSQQQQQQHRRLYLWNTQHQQQQIPYDETTTSSSSSSSSPIAVHVSTSTTTTTSSNMIEGGGGEGTSYISTSLDDGKSKKSNNNNMIVSLFLYIKDSTIRTTNSCTQLYKNHQRCNHIRQKQSIYRNTIKEQWETTTNNNNNNNQNTPSTSTTSSSSSSLWTKEMKQQLQNINGGITYEEYIFLQLGKEDRGKVMNLAFLMYGAPKVLPYALMFNKNMLPSTFTPKITSSTSIKNDNPNDNTEPIITTTNTPQQYYESTLRQYERRQAIINTLYNIEKQFITLIMGEMTNSNNNNNNFVTNLFTKSSNPTNSKSQQRMILHNVLSEMTNLFQRGMMIHNTTPQHSPKTLSVPSSSGVASSILQKCESFLYRTNTPFNGLELRLGHVPPCIVQGIANAVFHHGIPNSITQLTPKVFHRRKFVGHLEKITKEDEFLVSNAIDLSTIPYHLLMDTCHDRMIHVSPTSNRNVIQELRQALSEWLQLTQSKYGQSSSSLLLPPPSSSKSSGIVTPPPILETAKVHNDINKNVITASSKQSNQKITTVSTNTIEPTTATTAANVVDSDTSTTPKIYYNGNLARMILMAYYGCASICNHTDEPQSPTISHVPQLLYSCSSSSSNNKN